MGKRITQQARGKGSLTFKVRPRAYRYKITYSSLRSSGKAKIIKLFNSQGHSAPLVKIKIGKEIFLNPAASGIYEGQEILINEEREKKIPEIGDILKLKDIPQGTKVFNIEIVPGAGGKYLRSAGCSGVLINNDKQTEIQIKRRKIKLNENCRATVGIAAGEGRLIKPIIKAGKKHHMMLSKGRKWHRTSPVKVNAVDHPFGNTRSARKARNKGASKNAPPGRKVGSLWPKRTGKRK